MFRLLLLVLSFTCCKDKSAVLFQPDGKPTEELKELLELDGLYNPEDRLPKIYIKTQQHWFAVNRGLGGSFRGDLNSSENTQKIASIIERMGLFEASKPQLKHYNYAVVLGACKAALHARIQHLFQLYSEGVRFDKVVVLAGERLLRTDEGPSDKTEYDMAKELWEGANPPFSLPVLFVNAPKEGPFNPSTETTYQEWLKTNPKPGTVLAISSPFFVWQQHLVGKKTLPHCYDLDTVAPAVTKEVRAHFPHYFKGTVMLDTISKMIYDLDPRTLELPKKD